MTELPPPDVYRHPNGAIQIGQADGHGGHVMLTANPQAQPWLVTLAARQLKQQLMPGAQDVARHA